MRRRPLQGVVTGPFAKAGVGCLLGLFAVFLPLRFAGAQTSTWRASPGSGDWNTGADWTPATVPNGSAAIAAFGLSGTTAVGVSATTQVFGITFSSAAASPYTITISPGFIMTLSGAGILNQSGVTQNFLNNVGGPGGDESGLIVFSGTATAGSLVSIVNAGGVTSGAVGGATIFEGNSSAGSATLSTEGGSNGGRGGGIYFTGSADGGTASAIANGNGFLDISGLTDGGMNLGSIEGSGTFYLGANTLTVGGNNSSTTVSGVIADGGADGGTGGALVKTGTGALTLAGDNTYTGNTTVSAGSLDITGNTGVFTDSLMGETFTVDGTSATAPSVNVSGGLGALDLYVGYSGTGSLTQTGAASGVSNEQLTLAQNAGSKGVYTLSGGNADTLTSYIGNGGNGSFIQTSGTYTALESQYLGYDTGASGSYHLSGGLFQNYTNTYIGYNGAGTFTQSSGTSVVGEVFSSFTGIITYAGMYLGYNQGSSGVYDLSGGSLNASAAATCVGYSGTGTFIQTGGTSTTSSVYIGFNAGSSGVYDLNGGFLKTVAIAGDEGTSVFNFNGGILQSIRSDDPLGLFMHELTTANVQVGGAIVDTNGFDDTIAPALLHDTTPGAPAIDGGLTKIGLGTLSLTASNTYTGPTLVNAGTLELLDGGSLGGTAVTVGSTGTDATLQITGSNATIGSTGVGSVALAPDTGRLSLQDGEFNSLFIHGAGSSPGLVLGGSDDIDVDVSGTDADSIFLDPTRKASVTGTNFIIPTYLSLASGTDVLITAPGGGLATGGVFILSGPRYVGVQSILNTGTTVVLASDFNPVPVTAYFTGEFGSTWDTISGSGTSGLVNFSSDSAGTDNTGQLPFQITNVIFSSASAASGNLSTTLGQDFSINSLTMDGTSAAGSGQPVSISGNTLTILGTGGLGIVMDPGAGPLTINSSVVLGGTQTWINNSSSLLTISGSSISAANPLTIAGSGNTLLTSPFISSFTYLNVFGLTMAGTGELTLGGVYPSLEDDNLNTAVTSGTLAISGNVTLGNLLVDGSAGSSPTVLLGPGATLISGNITIGAEGRGTFNQTGGTVTVPPNGSIQPDLYLGYGAGSTGVYNLIGGSLNVYSTAVGESGTGIFTQTGGAYTGSLVVGDGVGSVGIYNLIAGSTEMDGLTVGNSGSGSFIQTGGTNEVLSGAGEKLFLGVSAGSTGVYTLSGGTLIPYEVTGGAGTSTFNFNGGILQAPYNGSTTSFMSGLTVANVQAGGAIIDSNSNSITISQSLVHDTTPGAPAIDGGLTKIGVGTLTLSGTNSYTGTTTVAAGTLELAKEYSLYNGNTVSWTADNIVVNSGATLALRVGGPGDFTAADIAALTPLGSGTGGFRNGSYIGIDTTDGSLTYSTPITDPNGGANSLGLVKLGPNTLTLAGDNTYTDDTIVTGGTLAITGAVVSATAEIIVDGSAPDAPAATLAASGSLNTAIAIVGQNGLGSFTQTGGVNTNIALVLGANPGSSGSYTMGGGSFTTQFAYVGQSGSGSFIQTGGTSSFGIVYVGDAAGGTGAFTLGAGSLESFFLDIGAATGCTGVFLQTGGTAAVSDAVYIGQAGSYTLSGGELSTTAVTGGTGASVFNFNGGALQASGSNSAFISGLAAAYVRAGGAVIDTNGYDITISQSLLHDPYDTAAGTLDADGGLKKIGLGMLTLTGSSNYAGGTLINTGTLQTENARALGAGPATLNTGATLAPVGRLTLSSFTWNGGTVSMSLGTDSSLLQIAGGLTDGGAGGTFDFTAGSGFALNTTYTLAADGSNNFILSDLSGNALDGVDPTFALTGTTVDVDFIHAAQTGFVWLASPTSGDWNTGANWTGGVAPNSGTASAIFETSSTTSVSLSQNTHVNSIVFNPGASAYTITAGVGTTLTLSGTGIINNSGTTQNFRTTAWTNSSVTDGVISFTNDATAGSNSAFNNSGGKEALTVVIGATQSQGETSFADASSAGNATFYNESGKVNASEGGETVFSGSSTAANGTFVNEGGAFINGGGPGAGGGATVFNDNSTAAHGTFSNYGSVVSGAYGASTTFNNTSTAGYGTFTNDGGAAAGANSFGGITIFYDSSTAGNGTFTNNGGAGAVGGYGAQGGITTFYNTSSAGNGTFINNGGTVSGANGGDTEFERSAMGANGTFTSYGGTVSGAAGGFTGFFESSNADAATLIAYGGSNGGGGGGIYFDDEVFGGTARVEVYGNGFLDISEVGDDTSAPSSLDIGSIEGSGNIFLGSNTLVVGVNDLSTTFSGVIEDGTEGQFAGVGGSLTKTGTGTLTLSGTNTYTGGTVVNAGTLELGNASALGATTGNLGVNAGTLDLAGFSPSVGALTGSAGALIDNSAAGPSALTVNGTANATYAGILSDEAGTVALVKAGNSTLTLSGSNHYSGGTTIDAGTLQTENAHALGTGTATLNTGGTLAVGGQLGLKSLIWNGGDISMSLGTVSSLLQISGSLTDGGAGGTFDFTAGSGFALGTTYTLATDATNNFLLSELTGNALDGVDPTFALTGTTVDVDFIQAAISGNFIWRASPTSGDWNTGANWTGGVVPNSGTASAIFETSSTTSVSLSQNTHVNSIVFNPGASAYTITAGAGTTLTLSGTGILNNSGTTQNFTTASSDSSVNYGVISFNNSATAGSNVSFTNSGGADLSATNGGETVFNDSSTAGSGTFTNNGATAANLVGSSAGGGVTIFNGNSNAGNGTFINNSGPSPAEEFYQTGGGEIIFNGNSSAANGTFINNSSEYLFAAAGTIYFNDNSTAGDGTFTNNGSQGSAAASIYFSGSSKAGNATFTNIGLIQFSGNSSAGTSTLINEPGIIDASHASAFGETLFSGTSTAASATLIAVSGSFVNGASLSPGAIYFTDQSDGGTARVILNGDGSLNGYRDPNGGYLDISGVGDGTPSGMGIGSIEGNGEVYLGDNTLTVGGNNMSTTFSGVIQDNTYGGGGATGGILIKTGTGTLTLSGSNTYSGGTTINQGTLQTANASALGTGTATLNSGATLAVEGKLDIKSLLWNGGTIRMTLGTDSSKIQLSGKVFNGGAGGTFDFLAGSGFALNTIYELASAAGSEGFTLSDVTGNELDGVDPTFTLSGTDIDVDFLEAAPVPEIGAVTGTADNATIITGGTTGVDITVANDGPGTLDATVTGSASVTGSANLTVAANGNGTTNQLVYTGTTVGPGQQGTFVVTSTNASNSPMSGSVTVNVLGHADPLLTGSAALDLGFAHVGYASAISSANSITVTNGTSGAYLVELSGTAASQGNLSVTGMTGIAAGSSAPISATLAAGQGVGTIDSTFTYVFADDSKLPGANSDLSTIDLTVTGEVYSGKSTWAAAGGGFWGTLASGFGANWGANQGSPGLDPDFTSTDTATFGDSVTSGTAVIILEGATPSLAAVTFDNPNASYVIVQSGDISVTNLDLTQPSGNPGITLNGGASNALLQDTAGDDEISAPLTLATNAEATVTRAADVLTLSGQISGAGGLITSGAGTLVLSGSNSYTGGTLINSGVVRLGNASGLGAASNVLAINDGTLDLKGFSVTLGALDGGAGATITSSGTGPALLTVDSSANSTFGGVIKDGLSERELIAEPVPDLAIISKVGFTKQGSGTLTLTGSNTFTGITTIDAGLLQVNGSIASPSTVVNADGALGGVGTIGGDVTNGGIVAPGDAPGTLTVTGAYTQSAAGTLVIQIAGLAAGEHDLLAVGGAASLNGTLQLVRLNNFQFTAGETLEILTAAGGVTGKFSKVNTGTIIGGVVIYQPNDALLEFTQGSFVSLGTPSFTGLTPNQTAVAQDLDTVLSDPRVRSLIRFLDNQPVGNLPNDFDLIAPEQLTALYNISFAAAGVHQSNLEDRMQELRNGVLGFVSELSVSGPQEEQPGAVELGSDGKASIALGGKDILNPSPDNPWGVFISGNGDFVNLGGDYNAMGYDFTTGGVTIGIDYRVGDCMAVGIALDYAHTWTNLNSGGSIDADSGRAGVYATLFRGGAYLNAYAGGGYNSYSTQRAGLGGNASGDTDGGEFDSFLSTGYDFHGGAWTFGPTASVAYTNVGINPYTENGSLAPLTLISQNQDSVATNLGWEISYAGHVKGILITPEASAAWEHQYAFSALPFEAQLGSGAGGTFTVHGPSQGRDSAVVGLGVNVQWSPAVSWYLRYDGILNGPYQSEDVSGGVSIRF